MAAPQIRVGIDWDDNGKIYWEAERPLNILEDKPTSATMGVWQTAMSSTVSSLGVNGTDGATLGNTVHTNTAGSSFALSMEFGRDRTTRTNAAATHKASINTSGLTRYLYYSFMVRIRSVSSGTHNITVTPYFRNTVSGSDTAGTAIVKQLTLNAGWQRVTVMLGTVNTVSLTNYYAVPRLAMPAIGGAHAVFIDTTDFCMALSAVSGLESIIFNDGTGPAVSDNITPYTLEASWSIGTQDTESRISNDSSAVITVNNASGDFTPGGSGAYSTYMKPNLRGIIQLYDVANAAWRTMWTGFIKNYEIAVSDNPLEKRVMIELENNIFSLKSASPSFKKDDRAALTVAASTSNQVMRMLIERNAPNTAFSQPSFQTDVSRTDQCLLLAADAALLTPDTNFKKNLFYVGEDWDGKSFSTLLKAVVDTEQGWLFTRRDGTLLFKSGYAYRVGGGDTPVSLDLNTQAQSMSLSYGKNQKTAVTVDYLYTARPEMADLLPTPKDNPDVDVEDDEKVVTLYWGKKTNVGVAAFKKLGSTISQIAIWNSPTYVPPPDYTDDVSKLGAVSPALSELTSLMINGGFPDSAYVIPFDATKMDIVSIHPSYRPDIFPNEIPQSVVLRAATTGGAQDRAFNESALLVWYFYPPFWQQKPRDKSKLLLNLHNTYGLGTATTEIDPVAIRAVVNIIGKRERLTKRTGDAPLLGITPDTYEVSNTLLTSQFRANQLADFILDDYASYGYNVDTVKLIVADDADIKYNKILALEVGTAVTLTEAFFGLSANLHVIVGEKHVFKNEVLTTELTCSERNSKMSYTTVTTNYP